MNEENALYLLLALNSKGNCRKTACRSGKNRSSWSQPNPQNPGVHAALRVAACCSHSSSPHPFVPPPAGSASTSA